MSGNLSTYEYAKIYYDNGFVPIPMEKNTNEKKPLVGYKGRMWRDKISSKIAVESFELNHRQINWSNCQLGLLLDENVIVFDFDTHDLAEEFKERFPEVWDKAFIQETRKGQHLMFKKTDDLSNITDKARCFEEEGTKLEIDVKSITKSTAGTGGILMVEPSANKKWVGGKLPVLNELNEVPEDFKTWVNSHYIGKNKRKVSKALKVLSIQTDPEDSIFNTLSPYEIRFILDMYQGRDSLGDWVKAGLCIKKTFGENGYEPFLEWTSTSPLFKDEHWVRQQWNGFNPDDISFDWLVDDVIYSDYKNVENIVNNYPEANAGIACRILMPIPCAEEIREMAKQEEELLLDDAQIFDRQIQIMKRTNADVIKYLRRFFYSISVESGFFMRIGHLDKAQHIKKPMTQLPSNYRMWEVKNETTIRQCNALQKIFNSPELKTYTRLKFLPPPAYNDHSILNEYTGMRVERLVPTRIDGTHGSDKIELFTNHFGILCGNNPEGVEYNEKLMAYKLRNPAVKLPLLILFVGAEGSGKTTFFQKLWSGILGSKYFVCTENIPAVVGKHNELMLNRLVICVDEIKKEHWMKYEDTFKSNISNPEFVCNPKGLSARKESNFTLWYGFSDKTDPIMISATDRRMVVFKTSDEYTQIRAGAIKSKDYFDKLIDALNDDAVIRAYYDYLMSIDLTNFNPLKRPETDIYKSLQQSSIDVMEHFFYDFVPFCDEERSYETRILWELYKQFRHYHGYQDNTISAQRNFTMKFKTLVSSGKIAAILSTRTKNCKYRYKFDKSKHRMITAHYLEILGEPDGSWNEIEKTDDEPNLTKLIC